MAYPFNPYGYNSPQNMAFSQQQPQTQAIQNGGFISVRSIEEARNWPIAPGNSITFKDEVSPYVYTKTMGFSQLDRPTFEVFRLVKEEDASTKAPTKQEPAVDESIYATTKEVDALRDSMAHMKKELETLRAKLEKRNTQRRKEVDDNV